MARHNLGTVVAFEVTRTLKKKQFWLSTLLVPVVLGIVIALVVIANTTTARGLTVTCRLDRRRSPVGHRVSDAEIATVNLRPDAFHGEWNYAIRPRHAL